MVLTLTLIKIFKIRLKPCNPAAREVTLGKAADSHLLSVLDALIALGYKPNQAAEAVHRAQQALADEPAASGTEQLVTWVLRSMGRAS